MKGNHISGRLTLLVTLLSLASPGFALAQNYEGPLLETHAHIVQYQSETQSEVQYRVDAREAATALTAASYVASLDRNNIKCTLGFHGIAFDGKQQELLDHATRLLRLYPDRFILFAEIFRNNPLDWFDATKVGPLLASGLFEGFGEAQFENPPLDLDETLVLDILPDDVNIFLPIYDVLGNQGLFMMAHPSTRDGLEQAVRHDPTVTWIIHGPQVHGRWNPGDADGDGIPDEMEELERLLDGNPNLYYTLDFGESLDEFLRLTKTFAATGADDFLAAMNANFDTYLETMVSTWKDVIERHPDRFLWGTDMALPEWQWANPEVIDMMVKFSRAFIGRLDPNAAEKYAYKNAETVLGGCPVLIDIKPGSDPNSINLGSGGTVPVAILSTRSFDATTVDPTTVTLASAPVKLKGKGTPVASFQDVNGDGLLDLVVHVSTETLELSDTDTIAVLEGKTFAGDPIKFRDTVRVVP